MIVADRLGPRLRQGEVVGKAQARDLVAVGMALDRHFARSPPRPPGRSDRTAARGRFRAGPSRTGTAGRRWCAPARSTHLPDRDQLLPDFGLEELAQAADLAALGHPGRRGAEPRQPQRRFGRELAHPIPAVFARSHQHQPQQRIDDQQQQQAPRPRPARPCSACRPCAAAHRSPCHCGAISSIDSDRGCSSAP